MSIDHGFTALVDRARVYEALGRRDQAVADLGAALAIRPSNDEAKAALKRLSAGTAKNSK
jgi:lipoprotein NlpI